MADYVVYIDNLIKLSAEALPIHQRQLKLAENWW